MDAALVEFVFLTMLRESLYLMLKILVGKSKSKAASAAWGGWRVREVRRAKEEHAAKDFKSVRRVLDDGVLVLVLVLVPLLVLSLHSYSYS